MMYRNLTVESCLSLLFGVLATCFLFGSMQSCSTSPTIQVEEVSALAAIIAERTEEYVLVDESLMPVERETHLSRIERMRDVLVRTTAEGVGGELAATAARPVCDLHDVYVTADERLEAADRARALRSTEIMRRVLDAAAPRQGP